MKTKEEILEKHCKVSDNYTIRFSESDKRRIYAMMEEYASQSLAEKLSEVREKVSDEEIYSESIARHNGLYFESGAKWVRDLIFKELEGVKQ